MKRVYVIFFWVYGIAVLCCIAGMPAMLILEYLADTFPIYHNLVNMGGGGFTGAVVELFSGILFFLIPFFILYIPFVFILFYPMIWLNEKLNIDV